MNPDKAQRKSILRGVTGFRDNAEGDGNVFVRKITKEVVKRVQKKGRGTWSLEEERAGKVDSHSLEEAGG